MRAEHVLVPRGDDEGSPRQLEEPVDRPLDHAFAVVAPAVLAEAHVDHARQAELLRAAEDVVHRIGHTRRVGEGIDFRLDARLHQDDRSLRSDPGELAGRKRRVAAVAVARRYSCHVRTVSPGRRLVPYGRERAGAGERGVDLRGGVLHAVRKSPRGVLACLREQRLVPQKRDARAGRAAEVGQREVEADVDDADDNAGTGEAGDRPDTLVHDVRARLGNRGVQSGAHAPARLDELDLRTLGQDFQLGEAHIDGVDTVGDPVPPCADADRRTCRVQLHEDPLVVQLRRGLVCADLRGDERGVAVHDQARRIAPGPHQPAKFRIELFDELEIRHASPLVFTDIGIRAGRWCFRLELFEAATLRC